MFTGIVEEVGRVRRMDPGRLEVACGLVAGGTHVGDSIAVGGVCLTVVDRSEGHLAFDLSEETIHRTSLAGLGVGDSVNLERPVTPASRLGGHIVQGHVDAVGIVRSLERDGSGATLTVDVPPSLRRYVVEKGSICVDGVSLTIAGVGDESFSVALIPHTLSVTTLGSVEPGRAVNLEADVIAKYVESLMQSTMEGTKT